MTSKETGPADSYNTQKAAEHLGVSRNTLLRWFREGRVSEPERDFRGWRRFTLDDLERIQRELEQGILPSAPPSHRPNPPRQADPVKVKALPSATSAGASRTAFLRQVHLFSSLTDSDLVALDAVAEFRGYPRGAILFHEGQPVLGLHVLLKGRIKLTKLSPEGREQILEIVEPVSTFAETPLFDKEGRYPTLGRASVVSSILTIPKESMQRLMRSRPGLSQAFLGAFAERMKELMKKVEEATFLTVDERLARYILKQSTENIIENLNLAEIAAIIGAARESVSRALGRLNKAEIVSISKGRLLLLDEGKLAQIA
ncbi:MAG: cyclic nucleotide-binding domain-containing protein [Planctomycetota bacterium]|nr:cyclic nucleotide-binding domain-containing protein [Planctomycetota bacterium]